MTFRSSRYRDIPDLYKTNFSVWLFVGVSILPCLAICVTMIEQLVSKDIIISISSGSIVHQDCGDLIVQLPFTGAISSLENMKMCQLNNMLLNGNGGLKTMSRLDNVSAKWVTLGLKVRTRCARSVPAICHNMTRSCSCQVRIGAVEHGDKVCGAGHSAHAVICKQWCERKCGQSSYKNRSISSQSNTWIGQRTPAKLLLLLQLHPFEGVVFKCYVCTCFTRCLM